MNAIVSPAKGTSPAGDPLADSSARLRADRLLAALVDDGPAPTPDLADRVVRRARWQHPLRQVLDLASGLVGAVASGATIVVGRKDRGA